MITKMEHLIEDEFQDIYHKHITNMLSDARSAKQRTNSLHTTRNALVETTQYVNEANMGKQTKHWTPWWISDSHEILCITTSKKVVELQNQAQRHQNMNVEPLFVSLLRLNL